MTDDVIQFLFFFSSSIYCSASSSSEHPHSFKRLCVQKRYFLHAEKNYAGYERVEASCIRREMESTRLTHHAVSTSDLLDAIMMDGREKAGLSSGIRYAAAAIIVAYQKGV